MAFKGRILVVDDEYLIRWSLQQSLVEQGYEVLLAASAEEGLALMEREEPDLALLDIQLPGMSGMDLLLTQRGVKAGLRRHYGHSHLRPVGGRQGHEGWGF